MRFHLLRNIQKTLGSSINHGSVRRFISRALLGRDNLEHCDRRREFERDHSHERRTSTTIVTKKLFVHERNLDPETLEIDGEAMGMHRMTLAEMIRPGAYEWEPERTPGGVPIIPLALEPERAVYLSLLERIYIAFSHHIPGEALDVSTRHWLHLREDLADGWSLLKCSLVGLEDYRIPTVLMCAITGLSSCTGGDAAPLFASDHGKRLTDFDVQIAVIQAMINLRRQREASSKLK